MLQHVQGGESLIPDLRQALRGLRRSPSFTATALLALVLGIGASTAIFSLVNAVHLKPLPFPESDRLVMLMISANRTPVLPVGSPAQFIYWQTQTDIFSDLAAFTNTTLNYPSRGTPEQVRAAQVSEGYFRTFGAPIVEGRGFTVDEDLPGGAHVAVLSHAFWSLRLGSDPEIIGKTILLSGNAHTVVGIAGPNFDMRELGDPELWVPLQTDPNTTDRAYLYQVAARLQPGVTLAQAQDRLEASVPVFRERFPDVLPRGGFSALPLQEAMVGSGVQTTLVVLLGAVGLLLLIACANVASLLLVHANGRRHEIAVRSALGATRGRIAKQLLIESALLSLIGGGLGLIVGFLGVRVLLNVDTAGLPRVGEFGELVGLDWRIISFTLVLSFATVLLFGLAPALAGSRANLADAIKSSVGRAGGDIRQSKARSLLVTAEVGLAVVLLVGAGLLVRTSFALHEVDPGFDATNVLTMQTSLSDPRYATAESVEQLIRSARERIRSVPGVVDAVATCCIPMQPGWGMPFNIPGRSDAGLYTGSNAVVFTSPGYFETLGIPILRGRTFTDRDDAGAPPVAIINDALAKLYWTDDADPLDDQILIGGGAANVSDYAEEPVRQIIGIVGDVRMAGLADNPEPAMYVPQAQMPDAVNALVASTVPTVWLIRTQGDPTYVSEAVQEELRVVTGLPVTEVRTMQDLVSLSVSRQRLHMLLMTVFAGSALLLAAIGVFGLMAYAVQQRTQEFGVRIALGATPGKVGRMLVRQGMVLVCWGIAGGLVAAYFLANVLASILFGVDPHDVATFVLIPFVLILVALVAVAIPARRAGRLNPLLALRRE